MKLLYQLPSNNISTKNNYLRLLGILLGVSLLCAISLILNLSIVNAMPKVVSDESLPLEMVLQAEVTRDEVNVVARELWCPLCSGVRLDTCELKACDQMREEIAIQLADGASSEEITDYFLAQYGPQILGEPPRSGFNWLAWIVPVLALLGGGAYLLVSRRNLSNQLSTVGASEREHSPIGATETSPTTPEANSGAAAGDQNNYEQLLDKELESYD